MFTANKWSDRIATVLIPNVTEQLEVKLTSNDVATELSVMLSQKTMFI